MGVQYLITTFLSGPKITRERLPNSLPQKPYVDRDTRPFCLDECTHTTYTNPPSDLNPPFLPPADAYFHGLLLLVAFRNQGTERYDTRTTSTSELGSFRVRERDTAVKNRRRLFGCHTHTKKRSCLGTTKQKKNIT